MGVVSDVLERKIGCEVTGFRLIYDLYIIILAKRCGDGVLNHSQERKEEQWPEPS